MAQGTCAIDDCERSGRLRRGWCSSHYQRWWKYGDPLSGRSTLDGDPLQWLREQVTVVTDDCIEWPFAAYERGYGFVTFGGKRRRATHASLELSGHPQPSPPGDKALHSCDNPPCINPRHLRWGTQADNAADRDESGATARGERQGHSVLTAATVRSIRSRYADGGLTQMDLAREYGVSGATINRVIKRKSWEHV